LPAFYNFESKIKVAEFIRETEKLKHQWELERMRIKSAEIRKSQKICGRKAGQ